MTLAPSAMAAVTWRRTSSMAAPRSGVSARRPATSNRPSMAKALKPGRLAVLVDVEQLGQVVVVDDRHRAGRSGGTTRPSARAGCPRGRAVDGQRGDQLLADGVERRVGHLGEELGEVVVEQAGPVGQHGDGGVGAHRADRLARRSWPWGPRMSRSSSLV